MANNINELILEGRLCDDVRVKSFPAKNPNDRGRIVVNGTIATDYGTRKDPATNEWVHNTVFTDFEYWLPEGSSHRILNGKKGETYLVMGSMIDMSYTNKDGQKIFKSGASAQTIVPTGSAYAKKADGGNQYVAQPATQTQPAQMQYAANPAAQTQPAQMYTPQDDSIPF